MIVLIWNKEQLSIKVCDSFLSGFIEANENSNKAC